MNQRGAVIAVVAGLMFVFMAMAMLALDIGHLYIVRNELQNAADAGALAGVRVLYNPDGTINTDANTVARNAAIANKSEKLPVEVLDIEVQRGHWTFDPDNPNSGVFTPSDSLAPVSLPYPTPSNPFLYLNQLDGTTGPIFINAVRIMTRRGGTPGGSQAKLFFAGLWGYLGFDLGAKAIAYIGFSQPIEPEAVDKPIAICKQAIFQGGQYNCVTGRMIDSSGGGPAGGGTGNTNTTAWTDFTQGSGCGTANPSSVRPLLAGCLASNSTYLFPGSPLGTTNGMDATLMISPNQPNLFDCWKNASPLKDSRGYPRQPWRIKIPMIDCQGFPGPIVPCENPVIGTVELDVLWITEATGQMVPPWEMDDGVTHWTCSNTANPDVCWSEFISAFQLEKNTGTGPVPATAVQKALYIKPTCNPSISTTIGAAFDFDIKNPVLVN
jgi:Flp pilus assembly protein TadG